MDAIKNHLWLQNEVSLALDGRTSTNKLAITSGIAYHLHRNWALQVVQLALVDVDQLFYSVFKK